jgi:hypothetical protein
MRLCQRLRVSFSAALVVMGALGEGGELLFAQWRNSSGRDVPIHLATALVGALYFGPDCGGLTGPAARFGNPRRGFPTFGGPAALYGTSRHDEICLVRLRVSFSPALVVMGALGEGGELRFAQWRNPSGRDVPIHLATALMGALYFGSRLWWPDGACGAEWEPSATLPYLFVGMKKDAGWGLRPFSCRGKPAFWWEI